MRKTVDVQWVRRTFARLEWLRRRFTPEHLADELMKHGADDLWVQIAVSEGFLYDLTVRLDACVGEAASKNKGRACIVCGGEIWIGHGSRRISPRSDSRYCSAACRQRAYRARVTARRSVGPTDPSQHPPVGDTSPHLSDAEGVTTS